MYSSYKCLVHYCKNNALSAFDSQGNISEERNYCLDHIPDPGKAKEDIYNYIAENDKIIGLCANGLIFRDLDFTGKKFFGCSFTHCTFINVHSDQTLFRLCVFDFAVFNDCTLIKTHSLFNSFAACTFTHTTFTSSDMIQTNFNNVKAFQSSFDDSDLFNSQFIKATLVDTSFRNCNLKKTLFYDTTRQNVSYKMSNTREALFSREGSDLFLGTSTDNEDFSNTPKQENSEGEKK